MVPLIETDAGYKVKVTAEGLSLPFIANLFKKDKTRDKHNAVKEVAYLYWCYNPDSPYKQSYRLSQDGGNRENIVKRLIFGEETVWTPDSIMEEAIKGYNNYIYETNPLAKVLASAEAAFLKLQDYFDGIDMAAVKKNGDLLYSPTAVQKTIEGLAKSAKQLQELRKQVQESLSADTSQVRGGVKKTRWNS